MDEDQRRSLARARLMALRSNLPRGWDGTDVSNYNSIVAALTEAYRADFSPFRISEEHMKPVPVYFRLRARSGRPEPPIPMSKPQYCSEDFARRQLEGAYVYLQQIESHDRHSAAPRALPRSDLETARPSTDAEATNISSRAPFEAEKVTPKRRGRKTRFTQEQLDQALKMKSAGQSNNTIAKVLYGPSPTAAQRRSVPTTLKHHFGSKKTIEK
jgi:hypothetical protein